jgi:hypothetical protein
MMDLLWASTAIPLMEQGTTRESGLIQIASEKHATPSDHSSFVASSRYDSSGGSGDRGGTEGLGEDSVERVLEPLIWTK